MQTTMQHQSSATKNQPIHPSKTQSATSRHVSKSLRIETSSREVFINEIKIELTRTEFDLLTLLANHPRQVLTPQQIQSQVWSSSYYTGGHVVETHVHRLRNKLGESGQTPRYIHTVRGVGYRFEPNPEHHLHTNTTPHIPTHEFDLALDADGHVIWVNKLHRNHIQSTPHITVGEALEALTPQPRTSATKWHIIPILDTHAVLIGYGILRTTE